MIQTRAGLQPDQNNVIYNITSQQVEKYLQVRFDAIANNIVKGPRIDLTVTALKFGEKFMPLAIFMPTTVLASQKYRNTEELSIFHGIDAGSSSKLIKEYYEALQPYTYKNRDIEAYASHNMRTALGLKTNTIGLLRNFSKPCVKSDDSGGKYVIMLLDPIKVFNDMLKEVTQNNAPPRHIAVFIQHTRKLNDKDVQFTVIRRSGGKSTGNFDMDKNISSISRLISGRQ